MKTTESFRPGTISRRNLLRGAGGATAGFALGGVSRAVAEVKARPPGADFVTLLRQPDTARAFLGDRADEQTAALLKAGQGWSGQGVELGCMVGADTVAFTVHAPNVFLRRLHLRWHGRLRQDLLVLGDAWERSYGDLAWLPMQAERVLPWYCLLTEARRTGERAGATDGYGVLVGAAAFAFWQVDERGISLWLDLRNGGSGVRLGDRVLPLCTVAEHRGRQDQNPFQAARELCQKLAAGVRLPAQRGAYRLSTIYGSNDWYYAYGRNTAEGILRDADLMREVAPAGASRPFTVVDDGYQDRKRFPDMARLAEKIRERGVAPGVWVRPLRASGTTDASSLLSAARFGDRRNRTAELAFDPTVPEGRAAALAVVREAAEWGYDLIKHDFTTYELLGQWGSAMGASPSVDGWSFHDRSKTNAEIIRELYQAIRSAAGEDRIVLGCNTVGHLAAGIFDIQRTGDDVSGREWERTRRMGVNTLAFRLPQHRIFFATDADCVPITKEVPWPLTEQWLQVVAESGTVLLVSPDPAAIGPEQRRALRATMERCASAKAASVPLDWMRSRTPETWSSNGSGPSEQYDWVEAEGATPFRV